MKTSATNKKVRELIQAVKEGGIVPRPEFQRRLVWSRDDKNLFIDTVLRNYPFPEIYLAQGEVNLDTGEGSQLLVDGLQRVSTLIQYFEGSTELQLTHVLPYRDLPEKQKLDFLQYDVAVRDLGSITKEEVVDAFKRLNATKYSLLDIEVNNAVYAGALKLFAQGVADLPFFEAHRTFNAQDLKRMGDLRYALTTIITMIEGYFNRDEAFEEFLSRFNDEFPLANEIRHRLDRTLDFIEECGFGPGARVWRKADLFTLITELDLALEENGTSIQPSKVVERMGGLFEAVESSGLRGNIVSSTYYKAALQASNDRLNRVRRGVIVGGLLRDVSVQQIETNLRESGLV